MRNYYTAIRMVKTAGNIKCWWQHEEEETNALLQNGTATLEGSLAVSYKTIHTFTIWSSNYSSYICPNELKTCVYTLHTGVYSGFVNDCQNLEAITMSLSRRMDSPDNGILFRTNKKWAINQWKGMQEI